MRRSIEERLLDCGYDVDNMDFAIVDCMEDISDILDEYNLSIEELEDVLLYDDYKSKRFTCDVDNGIHIEEAQ